MKREPVAAPAGRTGTPTSVRQAAVIAEIIRDTTANPAPLGLMGFGLTTVLLNLHNAGVIPIGSAILAMGLLAGGFAQIIAGIMEWKKKNTFGTVAFTSYGFFWISLVALILMPRFGIADAADRSGMAAYLFVWGLFTVVMFVATLKMNRAIMLVFFALTILFFLLAGMGWCNDIFINNQSSITASSSSRHSSKVFAFANTPCKSGINP
jgi:succinate-acetate transporter protein